MPSESGKKKICVVGSGPSGMSIMYHLGKLPDDQRPEIVCYEKQPTWGGMWNTTWRTGTDEYGEKLHACMYHDLWTNSPKEMTEYPDYTYKTHFGKAVPAFVPGPVLKGYIEGRYINKSKDDLQKYIKFNTVVRWIEYNEETDDFTVTVKNVKENKDEENKFTHVIIATGLFGTPNTPSFPGLEHFHGDVMHAKDVRRARVFAGKNILLIGCSYSAWDLSVQFLKFGAKNVTMSYQTKPMGFKWPKGITERPLVKEFKEASVDFTDGTTADIDAVVFCTGYKLHHPFLPEELRINPEMSIFPDDLYKGIVWMKGGNRKLMYLGAMYCTFFLSLLDVQALWASQYLTDDSLVLSREEMLDDMKAWMKKKEKMAEGGRALEMIATVTEYLTSMCKETGYELKVEKMYNILQENVKHLSEDATTFRDKRYQSIHTGQLSAEPTKPWMEHMEYPLDQF